MTAAYGAVQLTSPQARTVAALPFDVAADRVSFKVLIVAYAMVAVATELKSPGG